VLHKFPRLTLLTWEATKLFSLPWEFIDRWLTKATHKTGFMAGGSRRGPGRLEAWASPNRPPQPVFVKTHY
jgi:hypothetical protein